METHRHLVNLAKEIMKLTFGPVHDSITTLRGNSVTHRFQRVLMDGVVIGSVELHLQTVAKLSNFGVVTVARLHKADGHS